MALMPSKSRDVPFAYPTAAAAAAYRFFFIWFCLVRLWPSMKYDGPITDRPIKMAAIHEIPSPNKTR